MTDNNETMIVDTTHRVIFESPDGGKTIYTRPINSLTRKVHSVDQELERQKKLSHRSMRMMRIVRLAESNHTLNDALEKIEMLYELVKENENN